MKEKENEKIIGSEEQDEQVKPADLLKVQGGAGLKSTVKTETKDISVDTKSKI